MCQTLLYNMSSHCGSIGVNLRSQIPKSCGKLSQRRRNKIIKQYNVSCGCSFTFSHTVYFITSLNMLFIPHPCSSIFYTLALLGRGRLKPAQTDDITWFQLTLAHLVSLFSNTFLVTHLSEFCALQQLSGEERPS